MKDTTAIANEEIKFSTSRVFANLVLVSNEAAGTDFNNLEGLLQYKLTRLNVL